MAIAFVRAKVAGRSSNKNAVAMAAYRSGSIIIDRASGKIHDYTKKQGVDYSEILSPIAATNRNQWLTDRAELWNRVEAGEKRYDARLAREIIIAIPTELERDDKIALVREYVQASFVDRGMIADINLHHLDEDNPHAHVMLTMRELKIDEQGTVSFGNKDRNWDDKKLYMKQKLEWDGLANGYLERAGFDVRIDSRSYEEQGIDRLPQVHLGVEVSQMRGRNIPTELGDKYDRIDWINNNIAAQFEEIYNAPEIDRLEVSEAKIAAPVLSEQEQERKDADFIYVAAEYPELKQTPEYKAAAKRAKTRYYDRLKSIPKQAIDNTPPPEPPIKKWQPTLQQATDDKLLASILAAARKLDATNFQAGNYQVRILMEQIEIKYRDELAMVIDISSNQPHSKLINVKYSLNQYETGLGDSIDRLLVDLERQREEERELQRQLELQQELERQRQQELERQQQEQALDRIVIFDDPDIEQDSDRSVDFSDLFEERDRDRSRQQDLGYSR